ncbi:hypothetical protein TSMEX_010860 [Taenia solium]|eukprot:TsM_000375500 transcript=TsM_000375500 gene=TsM_000375500
MEGSETTGMEDVPMESKHRTRDSQHQPPHPLLPQTSNRACRFIIGAVPSE